MFKIHTEIEHKTTGNVSMWLVLSVIVNIMFLAVKIYEIIN